MPLALGKFGYVLLGVCLVLNIVACSESKDPAKVTRDQRKKNNIQAMDAFYKEANADALQVGDQTSPLQLFDLKGNPLFLDTVWKDRPAVIVTASLTCPLSRRRCSLETLSEHPITEKIHPVIIYVIEAHPQDPADMPYTGFVYREQDIKKDQPESLDKRLILAAEFAKRVPSFTVLVDGMENRVWKRLGKRPNGATLVDKKGKVVAKQDRFDAKKINELVEKLYPGSH